MKYMVDKSVKAMLQFFCLNVISKNLNNPKGDLIVVLGNIWVVLDVGILWWDLMLSNVWALFNDGMPR